MRGRGGTLETSVLTHEPSPSSSDSFFSCYQENMKTMTCTSQYILTDLGHRINNMHLRKCYGWCFALQLLNPRAIILILSEIITENGKGFSFINTFYVQWQAE